MKRMVCLFLAALMTAFLFTGCQSSETPKTTESAPQPTQSPEEEKMLKILIIGNSHSNDTFWLLHEVFADQMPDQEVTLGILYYSGCTVTKHVKFATENQNVYDYHRNIDGVWETTEQATIDTGLCDQAWDIIVYQGGRGDTDKEYNLTCRRALEEFVSSRVAKPYKELWHVTWPSPEEPTFYDPSYRVQPPAGWLDYIQTNFDHDSFKQFTLMTDKAKEYLLVDETYEKVICSGAGVMNAHAVSGVPQLELWRDYTHLSDYGRLVAAYSFYTQITGNPVESVGIDTIPASLRNRYFRGDGDLTVTEEMKQVIITAAKHAAEDPWTAPARPVE